MPHAIARYRDRMEYYARVSGHTYVVRWMAGDDLAIRSALRSFVSAADADLPYCECDRRKAMDMIRTTRPIDLERLAAERSCWPEKSRPAPWLEWILEWISVASLVVLVAVVVWRFLA